MKLPERSAGTYRNRGWDTPCPPMYGWMESDGEEVQMIPTGTPVRIGGWIGDEPVLIDGAVPARRAPR